MTREELLKMSKPILFNTDMVRAILDGRKTVTRRIAKAIYPYSEYGDLTTIIRGEWTGPISEGNIIKLKSKYRPGDILYVRETWKYYEKAAGCGEAFHIEQRIAYRADENRREVQKSSEWYEGKWHPSIHMPKEAARIFLKVTDVRVERLQDITEEQACMEGTSPWDDACYANNGWHPTLSDPDSGGEPNIIDGFQKLWNSTIKKTDLDLYGWDANPWVWVIEFERGEAE